MPQRYKSRSERWAESAQGNMPAELIPLGRRLIDQSELDRRYHDPRLDDILGRDWFERMIRMDSREPAKAKWLWRYLIENRRMPGARR